MKNHIHKRIVKLKSQSRWIIRIFTLMGIIFGIIFGFISHPIGGTNAIDCPTGQQHLVAEDVCVYTDKDIVIQVTAIGNSTKKIKINKYFANSCTVDRGDGSLKGTISSSTIEHTYSTPGTYAIILSLTGGADRWTFQSSYSALITKANLTNITGVSIKYMPSLSAGFGNSETAPGDNFFRYFNKDGAITSLPDGSFDTSNIESVGTNFFYYFNNGGAITSLPDGSFNTSNIESAGNYFFSYFNRNGAITYLPNSFTLSSVGATKSNGYKNAFNSPNYTINRNVSDLVADIDISIPSSDMDTFSDNQPGRCDVPDNWLVNTPTQCSSTITITAVPASYGTVDSGSVQADYGTQITLSGNTVIIGNTTITATPKIGDYEFSGWNNSCGDTLTTGCNIVARFRSTLFGINYTVTFDSEGGNYTPNNQSVENGLTATKPSPDPEKTGYNFKGWYETGADEPFDFNTAILENTDLYARWEISKDIVIKVTAIGNSNKKIRINKYFANSYTIDWGDGSGGDATATNDHTYYTSGTYTITLSLTGGADRWTFQSTYSSLIPKDNVKNITGVLIKYMPSLASGFGISNTGVGDNFFRYFNYNGAITSLPDGSFDTSNIEAVGNHFFSYFNNGGAITRLPDGSFNTSNIESAGNYFFSYFNYGGTIASLPDGSFDTSNIESAGTYFFSYFNQNGAITYLPNSFTLNSVGATKSYGYKNAFNSPNYTININVSDLVADLSNTPSSDMDTFSDNQPGRCGVNPYWLQNISNACSVIYDYNGGNTVTSTGRYNANITEVAAGSGVTAPTNAGFAFSGWYTAPVGGENVTTVHFPSMDGDILYAQRTCEDGYYLENGVCTILMCEEGYHSEGGECIGNTKRESCTESGETPDNSFYDIQNVLVTYNTGADMRNIPTNCSGWICDTGFHTEDGETCISDTKQEQCIQSGAPSNANYITGNVEVTWSGTRNNGTWTQATNCAWSCNESFHTEDGETCISNTKQEQCIQSGAPNYASYIPGNAQATWSGTWNTGSWNVSNCAWSCIIGSYQLGNDKCVLVTTGTAPNYIDTKGKSFDMGSLTISDGTDTITILDRNLGATGTGTSCSTYNTGACGYFFQRGNNYGFSNPLTKTGTTQIDTSGYSRSNPYVSNTFIQGNTDWSSSKNNNLWGGSGDTTSSQSNPGYMRQGPCPEGYHVPTYGELDILKRLSGGSGNLASTKFYIPFAGRRLYNATIEYINSYADLQSSSPYSSYAYNFDIYFNGVAKIDYNRRNSAFSIRCVRDSDNNSTSILSFNTKGGQLMQSQTVPTGGTGHTPGYIPNKSGELLFDSRCKDENCVEGFDFQTDIITGNMTIYAKYTCPEGYYTLDGETCLSATTLSCEEGQHVEKGACTGNIKQAPCTQSGEIPNNSIYNIQDVTVTYNTGTDMWNQADNCSWMCDTGFHTEDGETCISNTKQEQCIQSGAPSNANYITGNIPVTWSGTWDTGTWNQAGNCSWMCISGYHTQDGETCVENTSYSCDEGQHIENGVCTGNIKQMSCTQSGEIPNNSIYNIQDVTVTYNTGADMWNQADNCSWMCDTGYHTENNESCIENTKEVSCREAGSIPGNSHYVIGNVEVAWKGTWNNGSWNQAANCTWSCNEGWSQVSSSKCVSITTGTAPNYIDTEGNSFDMGSLTISDGTNTITILDRNLGATGTGTSCSTYNTGACGYFFQRGNNYGFSSPLTKTGTTQIDTSGYSRSNPYVSNTFIQGNTDWSSTNNINLWGGSGDTTSSQTNPDYMRQGPCPEGYHIPKYSELNMLKTLAGNSGTFVNTNLYLPFGGYSNQYASFSNLNSSAYLWSSSPNSTNAYVQISSSSISMSLYQRARALSIRCVRDSEDIPTSILSFDTKGGQLMQSQTVPTGGTGHTPGYDPKNSGNLVLSGWYKDENYMEIFDFQTDVINGNTTIYAQWTCAEGWHTEGSECVENTKQMMCIQSGEIPDNSSYNVQNMTVTYNTGTKTWNAPDNCNWMCNSGYHTEDNESCTENSKIVSCAQSGEIPGNSHYVIQNVDVTWSGSWDSGSWSQAERCTWSCDDGTIQLGNNKCLLITTGTAPNYIDTEGNSFDMGSLTLSDGANTITILDRNLGATGTGTLCSTYNTGACGYFFQRGNNYGFSNPLKKTSDTQVNTNNNSWTNPYVSDTFIEGSVDWSSNKNNNLWGGSGDTTLSQTNPGYMRQGPCPEGYHVPTYGELNMIKTLVGNSGNLMKTNLFIPLGGYRNHYSSLDYLNSRAYMWSSTPNSTNVRYLYLNSNGDISTALYYRSYALSLRCVLDSDNTNTSILSFDTRRGQLMQGQTVPTGGTGHTPGYDPKMEGNFKFGGWCKDEDCMESFDFQTDIITGDTTIYAKLLCNPGYQMDENGECLPQHTFVTFVANPSRFPNGEFSGGDTSKTLEYFFVTGGYYAAVTEEIQIPQKPHEYDLSGNLLTGWMFEGRYLDTGYSAASRRTGLNIDTTYTGITLYARYLPFKDKTVTRNGVTFTIMDRNLGALDYSSGYSYDNEQSSNDRIGLYYQRGNNFGFPNIGTLENTLQGVQVENYTNKERGPGNYYYNGTFLAILTDNAHPWNSGGTIDDNLWGGNNINNPDTDKQGPCPEGYHVPSYNEWISTTQIFYKWAMNDGSMYCESLENSGFNYCMSTVLQLPFAGKLLATNGSLIKNGQILYWSSSPYIYDNQSGRAFYFRINAENINPYFGVSRSNGQSLRCFKDTTGVTLSYDSKGGTAVNSSTERWRFAKFTAQANPTRENSTFDGWYRDTGYTDEFIFSGDTYISEDTILYAKWTCASGYIESLDGQSCDKQNIATFDTSGVLIDGTITKSCTIHDSNVESCDVMAPNLTGYIILGRSTNPFSHTPEYEIGDTIPLIGDATYYAITSPAIEFTGTTPADNTTQAENYFTSQIDITTSNLSGFRSVLDGNETSLYDDSLVLMYNFDNVESLGESGTIVKDLSKNGYDGVVYGATWTGDGVYGGAYSFDGVDDYISLPNVPFTNNSTLSLRIDLSNINNISYFIGMFNDHGLRYDGSEFLLYLGNNYTKIPRTKQTGFVHVVVIRDLNIYTMYVNGESIGSGECGSQANTSLIYIGKRGDGYKLNSVVDELRVYNRALSEEEINTLYHSNLLKTALNKWTYTIGFTGLAGGLHTYGGIMSDISGNKSISRTINICTTGYHTEDGVSCIPNTKTGSCIEAGAPSHSSYVTGDVEITWNGTWNIGSWNIAANCDYICNTGYTKSLDGQSCEPNVLPYIVNHYQQNTGNNEYTLFESENKTGLYDSLTQATSNTYSGFTAKDFQQQTILVDTHVDIYYDRDIYTININLNGGTGTASFTGKYGDPVVPPEITRSGYSIKKRVPELPETMPIDGFSSKPVRVLTDGLISISVNPEKNTLDLSINGTSNDSRELTGEFTSDYFIISDTKGEETGYHATLSIGDLVGNNNENHIIPASNVQVKTDGIVSLSGAPDSEVGLSTTMTNWQTATGQVTYFTRGDIVIDDECKPGEYGINLDLKITVPSHTIPDDYHGTITYTLYED